MTAVKGQPSLNINGLGGRPVKWTQELVDQEIDALSQWVEDPNNLFLQKFCYFRGYGDRQVTRWKHGDYTQESKDKLFHALEKLAAKQQFALFEAGLTGKFKYPMCALILSHHHNINLKSEQSINANVNNRTILDDVQDQTKDLIDESRNS